MTALMLLGVILIIAGLGLMVIGVIVWFTLLIGETDEQL